MFANGALFLIGVLALALLAVVIYDFFSLFKEEPPVSRYVNEAFYENTFNYT
jgi:hypothetical protein